MNRYAATSMKKVLVALVILVLLGSAAAAYVVFGRLNQPFRGFSDPEIFVDIPSGAGSSAIGERLIAAGIVRDRLTYRVCAVAQRAGADPESGRVPVRPGDDAARGPRQDRPRRGLPAEPDVPRGLDHPRDGRRLRDQRIRSGRVVRLGGVRRIPRPRPRPAGEGSRRLSLSRHLRPAARQRRGPCRSRDGRSV